MISTLCAKDKARCNDYEGIGKNLSPVSSKILLMQDKDADASRARICLPLQSNPASAEPRPQKKIGGLAALRPLRRKGSEERSTKEIFGTIRGDRTSDE